MEINPILFLLGTTLIAAQLTSGQVTPSSEWEGLDEQCGQPTSRALESSSTLADSPQGATPWQVAIYRVSSDNVENWMFNCCGTIIAPDVVLTAASCVFMEYIREFVNSSSIRVVAGKSRLSMNTELADTQSRKVSNIFAHSSFQGEITGYSENIALLDINPPFYFNEKVMPICIDLKGKARSRLSLDPNGNSVEMSGWGLVKRTSPGEHLKMGSFNVESTKKCRSGRPRYRLRKYITHDKFCILTPKGRIKEDTGAGLVTQFGGKYYLQGVVTVLLDDSFSVATNISKHINWLNEAMTTLIEVRKCKEGFLCGDRLCIPMASKCDGVADCVDRSDEDPDLCRYMRLQSEQNKDAEGRCSLPRQLAGVSYRIENCLSGETCEKSGGMTVRNSQSVRIKCGGGTIHPDMTSRYACLNGDWFPGTPNCIRMCPPRKRNGVQVKCSYNSRDVDCLKYMRPGTEAEAKCQRLYKAKDSFLTVEKTVCQDGGRWSADLPNCQTDCGIPNKIGDSVPTISFGRNATYGRYPWHVALYKFNQDKLQWRYSCGGSVITPNAVLTAAHCLVSLHTNKPVSESLLYVAGGKALRDLTPKETNQQESHVKTAFIPKAYGGVEGNYQYDIAILELVKPFHLTDFVLPCCVDYDSTLSFLKKEATIIGWGNTEKAFDSSSRDNTSPVLLETTMTLLAAADCKDLDPRFQPFLTLDKFCGRYRNSSGAQQGDSGGGVIVLNGENYFLVGIISLKPPHLNTFGAFTSVASHRRWIRDILQKII